MLRSDVPIDNDGWYWILIVIWVWYWRKSRFPVDSFFKDIVKTIGSVRTSISFDDFDKTGIFGIFNNIDFPMPADCTVDFFHSWSLAWSWTLLARVFYLYWESCFQTIGMRSNLDSGRFDSGGKYFGLISIQTFGGRPAFVLSIFFYFELLNLKLL